MRRSGQAAIELVGPVAMCFALVRVTTLLLSAIDRFVPTEHLMLGYLLPTRANSARVESEGFPSACQ